MVYRVKHEYYLKNRDRLLASKRDYYRRNKVSILLKVKKYYSVKRDEKLKYAKMYRTKNKDLIAKNNKEYREQVVNIIKRRSNMRIYEPRKRREDANFRIAKNLRTRIGSQIRRSFIHKSSGSPVRDLGCSIPEFKKYLEERFRDGMSWKNYGVHGWHIDHIKPLKDFDLSDRLQFLEACHYTNMQPLWWYENLAKRFI